MFFKLKLLIVSLFVYFSIHINAEVRLFKNVDETKSFYGELTGYNVTKKLVFVQKKDGRIRNFRDLILREIPT